MRTLGVIPARGGSKRIPRKNMKLLNGKPLIYYTIMQAKDADFDELVVSTEDQEIEDYAHSLGVAVLQNLD